MQIIRVRLVNSKDKEKGCKEAPVEVLKELGKIDCKESKELFEFDKLNLEEIHVDLNNLEEANYLIFKNSLEAFEKNDQVFFIGGDHSISYSVCKAFEKTESNPLIILFDAYVDCCLSKRKQPNNREWLGKLIKEGFNERNIILLSSRSFTKEEIEFLKENKITLISMEILQEDLEGVCDLVMERARGSSGFYISIDINCVDPGFAPGTNCPEPGGMSSRDLIYFTKRLKLLENFKGGDIVEINPKLDFNNLTVKLGAKLLSEMI